MRTHEKTIISETYDSRVLVDWLRAKCEQIIYETELEIEHKQKRNSSAENLNFPYPEFRDGQRNMSGYVYLTARDRGLTFMCAPTGIGKDHGLSLSFRKGYGKSRWEIRFSTLPLKTP